MKKTMIAMLVVTIPLMGCADLTSGQQRALTGTAIGTAGGAAIGAIERETLALAPASAPASAWPAAY
jgi:hypothetical protein